MRAATPPGHDPWSRRLMAATGRTFIAAGTLLLLFVAYQLWGTGIETAREQRSLSREFDRRLAELGIELGDPTASTVPPRPTTAPTTVASVTVDPATVDPATVDPATVAPATVDPATVDPATVAPATVAPATVDPATVDPATSAPPASARPSAPTTRVPVGESGSRDRRTRRLEARAGELVARIKIPAIGVDDIVVGGVKKSDLKKGPGHYPGTPLPGSSGNAAIAGHRTTYGAPFFRLNELKPGDDIYVATIATGEWFRYRVRRWTIVSPHENRVLLPEAGRNTLTLTTCHPRYSAAKRLIVTADLVGGAVEQDVTYVGDVSADTGPDTVETTIATATTATTATTTSSADPGAAATPSTPATMPPADVAAPGTVPSAPDESVLSLDGRATAGDTVKVWWLRGTAAQWRDLGIWSAICALIAAAVWLVARGRRTLLVRWGIYAFGTVLVFLPALYVAFEQLSRLLPENV